LSAVDDLLVNNKTRDQGNELVKVIANAIGQEEESVLNLIQTVKEDYQVEFISVLWGNAYDYQEDAPGHES
jgi:F0F1-type ATP synthase alpha subunit